MHSSAPHQALYLRFKFCLFRRSVLILGVVLLIAILLIVAWLIAVWWSKLGVDQNYLPVVGLLLGFCYFLQKQQLEETRLMKELITDFNGRYDTMNEELQSILKMGQVSPAPKLKPCEEKKVVDYFNLCAEEYLFYDLGYVEPRVWKAWKKGMKAYAKDPRIMELWKEEKRLGSYYCFEFPKP